MSRYIGVIIESTYARYYLVISKRNVIIYSLDITGNDQMTFARYEINCKC